MPDTVKLHDLLRQSAAKLQEHGIANARREAEKICAEILAIPRLELALSPRRELSEEEKQAIESLVERRINHEPLQYILGAAPFRDLTLLVGPGVLIPRPETELLVDFVIKNTPHGATICDLCTGPGTIAMALATERPDLAVTATDICPDALAYAIRNRDKYQVKNLRLRQSNLFDNLTGEKFDFITANPPYVTAAEYKALDREVRDFEPAKALVSGNDGLELIRQLVHEASNHLNPGGGLILELGISQAATVAGLFRQAGFERIEILSDYSRRERFVAGTRA